MTQRSMLLFEQGIKTQRTLDNYTRHLDQFLKFSKIKNYDSLLTIPPKQLQDIIIDYIIYLKKTVSPNSVRTMLGGVRHFFVMNQVLINWQFIQKLYPETVKKQGYKAWSTDDITKMLDATKSLRNRAIIHFMASTGCRIGAFDGLVMDHLTDLEDGCKAVLIYPGTNDEYYTFLTPEASTILDEYLEKRRIDGERIHNESPVFRHIYQIGIQKCMPLSSESIKAVMFRLIDGNSHIIRKKTGSNYDIQIDHGYRKRWNTIMKLQNNVNANIVEKMLGHKNGLDGVYFTPTMEECFVEFKKAILALTISDKKRDELKIQELQVNDDRLSKIEDQLRKSEELNERNFDIMKLVSQGMITLRPGDDKSDLYIDNRKHNKFLKEQAEAYKDHLPLE